MAHGESLRLRNIQPTPRWHRDPNGVLDADGNAPEVRRPPSLRKMYRGQSKQTPAARKGKGIPPWHRRNATRGG